LRWNSGGGGLKVFFVGSLAGGGCLFSGFAPSLGFLKERVFMLAFTGPAAFPSCPG